MRWKALGAAALTVLAIAGAITGQPRQATAAPSGYSITGIDVSKWQGTIDWAKVTASGEDFAYAKVTEGLDYTDPKYATNLAGARAAGIKFGAYHYARPEDGNPRGQADRLLTLGGYALGTGRDIPIQQHAMLPPMLDIEWPWDANTPDCYGLSTSGMVAWISAFVDQVRLRTGQPTMIYTNVNWWNPCTGSTTAFGSQPLFVARYNTSPGTLPAGWATWTMWQYTNNGTVPGVTDNVVDRDVFNGDATAFARLTRREQSAPSGVRSPIPHTGGDLCTATPPPSWCATDGASPTPSAG